MNTATSMNRVKPIRRSVLHRTLPVVWERQKRTGDVLKLIGHTIEFHIEGLRDYF